MKLIINTFFLSVFTLLIISNAFAQDKKHTLKAGETLSGLAKKYF